MIGGLAMPPSFNNEKDSLFGLSYSSSRDPESLILLRSLVPSLSTILFCTTYSPEVNMAGTWRVVPPDEYLET